MAKGKHSAALFEVINNTKRPEAIAQSLRTPKWWFKGSQTPLPAPVEPPSFSDPEPAPSASDPTISPRPGTSRSIPPASSSARSSAVHMDFNRERQEVTLRLRYTTALVSGFFLCVVIGGAYVIGRHLNHGPQAVLASGEPAIASSQYLRQAPQAGVTDVTRQRLLHPPASLESTQGRRPQAQPQVSTAPRPAVASLVPASAITSLPRVIGLNYAIIQTYPESEKDAAEAACNFLNRSGIPCSLEKTEYVKNPNWVCLVGTAGFTKISSGDYRTYVDHIIALADKFPTSRFNRFDPKPFKWRG